MAPFELLVAVIVLAFVFDFINGFHDSANSIATVVSTRVLTPVQAVIWAAAFNFVAYWISEFKVADTVAKTVHNEGITLTVIFAGLIGAIVWNLVTWWRGIPSSSSHTLMGGFAGAAVAHSGWDIVNMDKMRITFMFIFLAPIIGLTISYLLSLILLWACKTFPPSKLTKVFKRLQLASSAMFSVGHGGNDAQKVMGIISAALIVYVAQLNSSGMEVPHWMNVLQEPDAKGKMVIKDIPHWVVIGCYTAISLGTLFGGWRIVKTMGTKITKMTPFEGVTAETAGAITLFGTEKFGIPVSTTHTITGAIIGGGLTRGISAVKWGVTIKILWAWILTIPLSGLMGALSYLLCDYLGS
jgi:PiT family inorganic phosphate transporter